MTTEATVVPPGRSARLFTIEPTSDRLTIIDAAGATVASTTTAAVAAVQAAAIVSDDGFAFVCDSSDRCIEIARTPAGFEIAGACDTRWAGIVATVLARHGGEAP